MLLHRIHSDPLLEDNERKLNRRTAGDRGIRNRYDAESDKWAGGEWVEDKGTKMTYNVPHDRWDAEPIRLRVASLPFAEGGMRLAYRAREILVDQTEIDVVVKQWQLRGEWPPERSYDEAKTQTVAEAHAQEFNKKCAGAELNVRIAFLPVSVVQLDGWAEPVCLEPFIAGQFVKYNDNVGHVLPAIEELNLFYCCFAERPTPSEVASAFSYFTYVASGRLLVVCDIQGVGNFFTDPQIHSVDGAGFGVGNRGVDGIMRFLASHKHSALCEDLGLPAPSLELENRHDGWDIQ